MIQVNGNDPDLGVWVHGSTQTDFHCPSLTLRYVESQHLPLKKGLPIAGGMLKKRLPGMI